MTKFWKEIEIVRRWNDAHKANSVKIVLTLPPKLTEELVNTCQKNHATKVVISKLDVIVRYFANMDRVENLSM